ncbi:MAG: hypothetical protein ACRDOH_32945, partial [Streptosporangiaceae bacterium]
VATRPHMPLMGREPGTHVFRGLDEHPGDEQYPGVVVLRLKTSLSKDDEKELQDALHGGGTSAQ